MWNGPTFQLYYIEIEKRARQLLDSESPDYLAQVDFEDYLDHLVDKLSWRPLDVHHERMTAERITRRVNRRDDFFERSVTVDESAIRLHFPHSPHPQRADFFKFGPSTTWLSGEPKWEFVGDALVLEVEATAQAINKGKEAVEFWIGGRNRDIEKGNANLRERIETVWRARREQIGTQQDQADDLLNRLNIPLHQDLSSSRKPISVTRREIRTAVAKPTVSNDATPELNHEDVAKLVDFVEQYARQFEVTPKPYAAMAEEELRDLLLGMINANYPGSATGETFNKLGKTDIHLRVASGEALVFECKFWSGAKAYAASIDQLFRYLTWRQNYGVLVHFCKLKDMTKAIADAQATVREHASFSDASLHVSTASRFVSRHTHPQDAHKLVEIIHLFFDLSL